MYRRNEVSYIPRPGGWSDSNSDSDDGFHFDAPGFKGVRRSNAEIELTASRVNNNSGADSNGSSRGGLDSFLNDCDNSRACSEPAKPREYWGRSVTEAVRLACHRGNLEKLQQLLSNGYTEDINRCFGESDENPLIASCLHGHLPLVEYLLKDKGAKPDARNVTTKLSALMVVVGSLDESADEETRLKLLNALISAGANVDLQDKTGETALMIAVREGRPAVAVALLEKGADPNVTDADKKTALFHAAERGDGQMCRLLLEWKADIQHIDRFGFTAPESAQDKNHTAVADMLYWARDTKWKPGLHPQLIKQLDEEAIAKRKEDADSFSVKEKVSIECFLTGVDAMKYIDNFRKHKISHVQFLLLDDDQLKEIGIEELGTRHRILEQIKSIQNVQWQSESLRRIATNKNVTAAEAVCTVVNIAEHLQHISGSLMYLTNRVKANPLTLRYDVERNRMKDLLKFCNDVERNCTNVSNSMKGLKKVLTNVQDYSEFQAVAEIKKQSVADMEKMKAVERRKNLFQIAGFGVLLVSIFKYQWICNNVEKVWNWK